MLCDSVKIGGAGILAVLIGCGSDLSPEISTQTPSKKALGTPYALTLASTGSSVPAVGIADVNRDSKADLLVASSSSLSAFRGVGDGTFYQTPLTYTVGTTPSAIVPLDVSGDGILDVAVANSGSASVSILIGNSTASFATAVNYTTGATPIRLILMDTNGDGTGDLVSLNSGGSSVSVLLGVAATPGTYGAKTDFAIGATPVDFCSADFNADNVKDLAILTSSNTIAVLLGNSGGTFQAAVSYGTYNSTVQAIGCGDFNRDSKADVVFSSNNGGTLEGTINVIFGKGDGTLGDFDPAYAFVAGKVSGGMIVANINGDSILDVAVSASTDQTVNLLAGKGDGKFGYKEIYPTNSSVVAIARGDVNGDGIADWASIGASATSVTFSLGN